MKIEVLADADAVARRAATIIAAEARAAAAARGRFIMAVSGGPFLKRKQQSAAKSASSIAPKTAFGIRFRNLVMRLMRRLPFVVDFFIGRELRDQVELPDYGF